MAGIGEASAVIGVVQVGFSLARTLSTYIGDYKDSRDSIISLAVQLETTIIHVRELNTLVRSSEAAGSVSEDSRKVAENAVKNSKRLIEKLVKLLTKADLPDDPDAIINIKPGDIDVRTLTKFYWPLVKPQVDVVNLELQSMKTEILLARSCIQAQTGSTPAERAEGADSIVALTKSKLLARRLLKEAKAEAKRAAMSVQQPDYAPHAPPGRNKPPARRSSGPYRSGTYDSVSDDGRETDLIAQDLRESILQDLQRKDVERKTKEKAEEAARRLAIENYQQAVKEKLARLQQSTDVAQRRMKEIFGPDLDEKLIQKFLDEQQSGQMQDEFGEMLLKIGVVPPLSHVDLTRDAGPGSIEKDGVRKPRRRWFFKRRSSRSSASTSTSNTASGIISSGPPSSDRTHFLHIVMSYDSVEGKYNYQTIDNPALRHRPCGPTCDFDDTLRAWQALPRSVKQAASRWVDDNFSDRIWHLHAALPIERDIRKTRKLLQKAVLGAIAHQSMSSIMLVFSSSENYAASETDSTAVAGGSVSDSSHTFVPMSDGGTSRVELSQTDIEQMREWLTTKGLSTAKIAELESLVVKQKTSAAAAAATQPSIPTDEVGPRQDNSTEYDPNDSAKKADIDRQRSGSHVRFVTGDVASPVRQQSNVTTTASNGGFLDDRGYDEARRYYQPAPYGSTSRAHDNLHDRIYYYPPTRTSSYEDDSKLPYYRRQYDRVSDGENPFQRVNRRLNQEVVSHRTRMDDAWAYPESHPPNHRERSRGNTTIHNPVHYESRDPDQDVRTINVYDPKRVRSRLDELEEELREMRSERRIRSRGREYSDTSPPSRYRRRSSESYSSTNSVRNADRHIANSAVAGLAAAQRHGRRERSASATIERETSPHPVRRSERPRPAHPERYEVLSNPYGTYPHPPSYPTNAHRWDDGDKRRFHAELTQTSPFIDHGILPIPRELSPEPMLDDTSDIEDAALNDAELKNKMLVKYTGGTGAMITGSSDHEDGTPRKLIAETTSKAIEENFADPGAEIDTEDPWGSLGGGKKNKRQKKGNKNKNAWELFEAEEEQRKKKEEDESAAASKEKEDRRKSAKLESEQPFEEATSSDPQPAATPNSTTPIPGVRRHNNVTVEDYDSDAETGTLRSGSLPRRRISSPSSASSTPNSPVFGEPEPRATTNASDRGSIEEVD